MKHDLEAFSRDIVTLIKKSGDSGGSGDKLEKPLSQKDFCVPTRETGVSPLEHDWGQICATSGDRKSPISQPVATGVPTVPTATTHFTGAEDWDEEGRAPAEWHAVLAEMERHSCPDWLTPDRWDAVLSDAENFLSRWGAAAHALGWTALDLFGVHPTVPASRFDLMGLLPLVQGGTVIALTEDGATLRRKTGAVLSYRRCTAPGAVLISEVRE
jgi:hypothetical protein